MNVRRSEKKVHNDNEQMATPAKVVMKETTKRDTIVAIEKGIQAKWAQEKPFQAEPPTDAVVLQGKELQQKYPKFFGCMAYPYMNGQLHLGHAFSLTKVEFTAGYERMNGKHVLFPLGFHCTGMPIKVYKIHILRCMG